MKETDSTRLTRDNIASSGMAELESGLLGLEVAVPAFGSHAKWLKLDENRELILWTSGTKPAEGFVSGPSGSVPRENLLDRLEGMMTPSDVFDVATRYGVLMACDHGLPYVHNARPPADLFGFASAKDPAFSGAYCFPMQDGTFQVDFGNFLAGRTWRPDPETIYAEPASAWLNLAEKVRAVIHLTYELGQGRPGKSSYWHVLMPEQGDSFFDETVSRPEDQIWVRKLIVSMAVTQMLANGRVRPIFLDHNQKTDHVEWDTGIYGVAALQLLGVITGSHRFAVCDHCHEPYGVRRTPAWNRRQVCGQPECKKWAVAERKRENRASSDKKKKNAIESTRVQTKQPR